MHVDKDLYISASHIMKFLVLSLGLLVCGALFKSYVIVIPLIYTVYCIATNRYDKAVLFIIMWAYIYNYYIGQAYITNIFIHKYLLRANIYLLVVLVLNIGKMRLAHYIDRALYIWCIGTLAAVFISDVTNSNFNINIINYPDAIYFYFAIMYLPKKTNFNSLLLNLILAIGILQLIVSVLQVAELIPGPIEHYYTSGYGIVDTWEPGMDDIASGTMGTGKSNVTSWIGTILYLFLLSIGITKNNSILVMLSFTYLLQYATVDSKSALGMTVFGLLILAIKHNIVKIIFSRKILYLVYIIISLMLLKYLWNMYYTEYMERDSGIQQNEEMLYSNIEAISNDIMYWGKFRGFMLISEDYYKKGHIHFIVGYGRGRYMEQRAAIESKDVMSMQLSNITRSRSSFIRMYGEMGILGISIMVSLFIILAHGLHRAKYNTIAGQSFKKSGIAILYASAVFMFIYSGHHIRDLAFTMYVIIYALINKHERDYRMNIKGP